MSAGTAAVGQCGRARRRPRSAAPAGRRAGTARPGRRRADAVTSQPSRLSGVDGGPAEPGPVGPLLGLHGARRGGRPPVVGSARLRRRRRSAAAACRATAARRAGGRAGPGPAARPRRGCTAQDRLEAPWMAGAEGAMRVDSAIGGALRDLAVATGDRAAARRAVDANARRARRCRHRCGAPGCCSPCAWRTAGRAPAIPAPPSPWLGGPAGGGALARVDGHRRTARPAQQAHRAVGRPAGGQGVRERLLDAGE
ncbi:hypothetical protein STENM36S_08460 [Streptomyces tendae]